MTLEQAIKNIELVLRDFKGTLSEHEILQTSLSMLKKALETTEK